jgi:hypothetical protein
MMVIDCFPTSFRLPTSQEFWLCLMGGVLVGVGCCKFFNRLHSHFFKEHGKQPAFEALTLSAMGWFVALFTSWGLSNAALWLLKLNAPSDQIAVYIDLEPTLLAAQMMMPLVLLVLFLGNAYFFHWEIVQRTANKPLAETPHEE